MKKITALVCIGTLACTLAACGGAQSASTSSASQAASSSSASSSSTSSKASEPVAGGWTMPDSFSGALSNEAAAAFDEASKTYDGDPVNAIRQLGSQVVAGENYMILCSDPVGKTWKVAIVYEDPSGKAEITNVRPFDLGKYAQDDSGKAGEEGLAGGWTVYKDPAEKAADLPKEVADAFSGAMEGLTGADYLPVLYMGSQVVNGSNYAILCEQTTVTADPVTNLAVVYIYAPATGDPEVMNIYPLDLAEFNQ